MRTKPSSGTGGTPNYPDRFVIRAQNGYGLLTACGRAIFCVGGRVPHYTHYRQPLYMTILANPLLYPLLPNPIHENFPPKWQRPHYTHFPQILYMRIFGQFLVTPHYTHFCDFLYTRIFDKKRELLSRFCQVPHYTHFCQSLFTRIFPSARKKFAAVGLMPWWVCGILAYSLRLWPARAVCAFAQTGVWPQEPIGAFSSLLGLARHARLFRAGFRRFQAGPQTPGLQAYGKVAYRGACVIGHHTLNYCIFHANWCSVGEKLAEVNFFSNVCS